MPKLKIKKGDRVMVISGAGREDKLTGEVLQVFPKENKVLVSGVNVVVRHQKQTASQEGGRISKPLPVHVSNVALLDPKDDQPTRVGYKMVDGKKVRYAKRSGEIIDV